MFKERQVCYTWTKIRSFFTKRCNTSTNMCPPSKSLSSDQTERCEVWKGHFLRKASFLRQQWTNKWELQVEAFKVENTLQVTTGHWRRSPSGQISPPGSREANCSPRASSTEHSHHPSRPPTTASSSKDPLLSAWLLQSTLTSWDRHMLASQRQSVRLENRKSSSFLSVPLTPSERRVPLWSKQTLGLYKRNVNSKCDNGINGFKPGTKPRTYMWKISYT